MKFPALALPALVLSGACRPAPIADILAIVDPDIATVVHVTWTTPTETVGHVEFGTSDGYGYTSPTETTSSTDHKATLYGLTADTECHFIVVADDATSEDQTITTDPMPGDVPTFDETMPISDPDVAPLLLTTTTDLTDADHSWVLLLTPAGQVVWYMQADGVAVSARPMGDGSGVYFISENPKDAEANRLVLAKYDGRVQEITIPHSHHDAIEGPDGGWVTLVTTFQDLDGVVGGDQVVEVAEDGTERVVWDAFDNLPVIENDGWTVGTLEDAADWTHANGLFYDPDDDTYVVSFYFTQQVVKIDRLTGETRWILGGVGSDFTFTRGAEFGPQHAPELGPDGGVRVFDNRTAGYGSRLTEYALDTDAGTATLTWSWDYPGTLWTPVLGDVHRFEDGGALGTWGITGNIVVVSPEGVLDGELQVAGSVTVGQVDVIPSMYGSE